MNKLHTSFDDENHSVLEEISNLGVPMKFIIVLSMMISSAFANQEVLLTCTRTSFSDLDKIVVSTSDRPGEVIVTETDELGASQIFVRDEKSFTDAKELELSSWYGHSRKLTFDGSSWTIEYNDECSGGVSSVVCN